MRNMADRLRKLGINNNLAMVRKFGEYPADLVCEYDKDLQAARCWSPSRRLTVDEDPYNNGAKLFYGKERSAMGDATEWAHRLSLRMPFMKSPFGGKVHLYVIKRAAEFIKSEARPKRVATDVESTEAKP